MVKKLTPDFFIRMLSGALAWWEFMLLPMQNVCQRAVNAYPR